MRLVRLSSLRLTALTADRGEGAHDFAETGAVDVRHFSQVQDDLLVALVEQAVHLVLEELVTFAQLTRAL